MQSSAFAVKRCTIGGEARLGRLRWSKVRHLVRRTLPTATAYRSEMPRISKGQPVRGWPFLFGLPEGEPDLFNAEAACRESHPRRSPLARFDPRRSTATTGYRVAVLVVGSGHEEVISRLRSRVDHGHV